MSKQRTWRVLRVKDFDDAIKQLVDLLRESDTTAEDKVKAFVLRGWPNDGLGASAVLTATAKLLKCDDSDMQKYFGKILHVDCSQWKNRRTMQRAIAEELNLRHAMHFFDKQDEDDDFRGVDESSREEIASIGTLINQSLRNERFLLILQYGGVENIDLVDCGIPAFGKGKLLCTNYGRFQFMRKGNLISSFANVDILMYMHPFGSYGTLRRILHEEAVGVIGDTGMDGINPDEVFDCFLYSLFLTTQRTIMSVPIDVDFDWATHACNYWICDGIVGGDRAWEIGNALYGVIPRLGNSTHQNRMFGILSEWRKQIL